MRTPCKLLIASMLVILATHARATDVVLHDVRLIDGNGGVPQEHVDVAVKGDRIEGLSAATGHPPAPGAVILDFHGKSLLPGLISDHSHLGLTNGTSAGGNNATPDNILRQLKQYQAYGVTTVVSLGLNQASFYTVAAKVRSGEWPGADMLGADRGFGAVDGAPPAAMGIGDAQVYRPRTEAEARREVRETAERHPALIKIWVDDFHGKMPVKLAPPLYKAIIDEAHAQSIRVAAHVFYLDDAKRLVTDGVDVLAHGVRDTRVDEEFIQALKARHVWYVPTLGLDEGFYLFAEQPDLAARPLLRHALQPELAAQLADPAWRAKVLADGAKLAADKSAAAINLQNVKILHDAGVQIGFGTDSGATPLRIAGFAEHHELALLVKAGLSPLQAIGTATKNAAALLHLDDRGVIEPGKRADFFIVDGDPSTSIENVDRIVSVWQAGKQVSGAL